MTPNKASTGTTNSSPLPSISIPGSERALTTHLDLLFRMKCDLGVDEINLAPSYGSVDTGESGWSELVFAGSQEGSFTLHNLARINKLSISGSGSGSGNHHSQPGEKQRRPLLSRMLKQYAARVVAREFRTAIQRKDDLKDWLSMVRACGDLVKLEIWKAIMHEGCTKSGVYLWNHNVSMIPLDFGRRADCM